MAQEHHTKQMLGFLKAPAKETGQSYRMLWWVAHALGVGFVFSVLLNMFLTAALCMLFPLKEIMPMFLTTYARKDQVVRVEPLEINVSGFNLLTEALVKRFVVLRETLDLQTEEVRWHEMQVLSNEKVQEDFEALMDPQKNAASPFKKRQEEGVKRSVLIEAAHRLTPSDQPQQIWMVDWCSTEQHRGETLGSQAWTSTITLGFEAQRVLKEDALMNPIGFTVLDYSISKRHGREDPSAAPQSQEADQEEETP